MKNKADIKWRQGSEFTMNMPDLSPDEELFEAARYNDLERAQELIDAGANVNAKSYDFRLPLVAAASRGHVEMVELLLDSGADINAKEECDVTAFTAFGKALWMVKPKVVELLVERGINLRPESEDRSLILDFINACKTGKFERYFYESKSIDRMIEYLERKINESKITNTH